MFADTLAITIDGVAKTLVRVNQDKYSSEYRLMESAGEYQLSLRNTRYNANGNRVGVQVNRHNVEFIHTIYGVDGAASIVRKCYFVFENDMHDELVMPAKTAVGVLAFGTLANLTKLVAWES